MQTARRLVVASLVSFALIAGFVWLVGMASPNHWTARVRVITTASELALREQLTTRDGWESRRGEVARWNDDGDTQIGVWARGRREQVVRIRETETGVDLALSAGAVEVMGAVRVSDLGERREVVWTQRSEVGDSPIARFVARFASGQVEVALAAELSELVRLAEGRPTPQERVGIGRGRVLEATWACPEFERCGIVRLAEPLELAGIDVRVRQRMEGEQACVRTPWPAAGEGVLPEAKLADCWAKREGAVGEPTTPEG